MLTTFKIILFCCVLLFVGLWGCGSDDVIDLDNINRGDNIANSWGFSMKKPLSRTVRCSGYEPFESPDVDWLCTYENAGKEGMLYVQSTPVDCIAGLASIPVYHTVAAEIWLDGQVKELDNAQYDYGGGHHNDRLEIVVGASKLLYRHSSIDYRLRACQPMDCVQELDSEGNVINDGCTCERTQPIVCRQVQPDGTFNELSDAFSLCEDDPLCSSTKEE